MKLSAINPNHASGSRKHSSLLALAVVSVFAVAVAEWATVARAGEPKGDNDPACYQVIYPPHPGEYSPPDNAGREIVAEVTAYNAGDPDQTDDTPCISASGDDVCNALAHGHKRCAANFVPFGTRLHIQSFGECLVVDRMNPRYPLRVDIAMNAEEKQRALEFGVKNLVIKIIE